MIFRQNRVRAPPTMVAVCAHLEFWISANKLRLEMQIEAILKPKKEARLKKRKKDADDEVLDRFADEEVSRLRETMVAAADEDERLNKAKLPAIAKLKLLPQVLEVLRKCVFFCNSLSRFSNLLNSCTGHRLLSPSWTTISWKV